MITLKMRSKTNFGRVKKRVDKSKRRVLSKAGSYVFTTARQSIKRRKSKSPVGSPPSTRKGEIKRAVLFAVEPDKDRVTIGPAFSRIKRVGMAHEFGTRFRKQKFKKRPFMGPAFTKNKDEFPKLWKNSVR